jgi:hypothetical protein
MVTYDTPGRATRSGGGGSTGHVPPECRSKERGDSEEDADLCFVRTRGRPLFSGSREGTTAGGEHPARRRSLLSVRGYHPLRSGERHAVGVRHVGP